MRSFLCPSGDLWLVVKSPVCVRGVCLCRAVVGSVVADIAQFPDVKVGMLRCLVLNVSCHLNCLVVDWWRTQNSRGGFLWSGICSVVNVGRGVGLVEACNVYEFGWRCCLVLVSLNFFVVSSSMLCFGPCSVH